MDAVVAVLRPKHESIASSKELLLTSYDILLVEMQALLAHDKGVQTFKQLPTTNILLDDEPGEALSSFLYRFTGGKNGGIRGEWFYIFVINVSSACFLISVLLQSSVL